MFKVFLTVIGFSSIVMATDEVRKPDQYTNSKTKEVLLLKDKKSKIGLDQMQKALVELGKLYNGYTPKSAEIRCTYLNEKIDQCSISATQGYVKDQF